MATTIEHDVQFVRITVNLPKSIADEVHGIPAQNRSKEISSILEEEFKRRNFLNNLDKFKKNKFALPKNFKLKKIHSRKIYEVFN